jgi:hypothetical protein
MCGDAQHHGGDNVRDREGEREREGGRKERRGGERERERKEGSREKPPMTHFLQ